MRQIPFAGCDDDLIPLNPARLARREQIAAQMAKASEHHLPADERRQVFILGDDPAELYPVRPSLLVQTEQVELGDSWDALDWAVFGAPYLGLGLTLGAILCWLIG